MVRLLQEEDCITSCVWTVEEAVLYCLASVEIVLEYSQASMVVDSCG